ncbi:MAG: 50S ribosomal protein L23 [Candidatus Micrarchaeota archaeon]
MNFVLYALTTEKAVGAIERDNKLTFIVEGKATKADVKKEIEAKYGEKVVSVNTLHTLDGRKKAVVRFERAGAASDLAAKLKLI